MLSDPFVRPLMIGAIVISQTFRLAIWRYYRDGERILPLLKLAPSSGRHVEYYKRFDTLLAPLPFVWCWLDIVAALLFFRWTDFNPAAGLLLAAVAAGRMRALQEIGHNALHVALCPSKSFQWLLSNVFFQFPTIKRDMHSRFVTHVKDHHPYADIPDKDPNLKRVIKAGMIPGISTWEFVQALFFPVSPAGLSNTITGNLRDATRENASVRTAVLRFAVTFAVIGLYLWLGGLAGFLVGWLIPVFAVYPLFAWWSLLSKHRWHTPYVPGLDRRAHDYEHGRATDFPGLAGAAERYLIFPMSDAYHLAHHIFPYVRSEYMPVVDRALKIQEPRYTQYISSGMIIDVNGQPAALSELYHRLTRPRAMSAVPAE